MARDVFISYQSADKECADRVCEALERQNISCWVAPRDIPIESELADNRKLPIFTLRIEDVQPPPGLLYFLGDVQWLDAFDGRFEAALGRLAEVIRQSAEYPAEATRVQRSSRPDAPVFTAARPAPGPPEERKNTILWIAAAVALCVAVALGGWLL